MNYRVDVKSGNALSILGFGCMRFPRGLNAKIDVHQAEKLVMSAIDGGVNYFDTGYIYGGSEQALGEIFQKNPGAREKIYIATKLPFSQCTAYEDFDRIFHTQLERLRTRHIDYYLMHNLSSVALWDTLRQLGIERWIAEQKKGGRIRQACFSFHGIQSEFLALFDEYAWDFCQIQYNYINENYQAGNRGLRTAHEKGLPVIVMEPLLGGKLATGLPKKAVKLLHDADEGRTPAAWALRWLWNQSEVTVLLSGMNSLNQLDENIRTAQTARVGMMSGRECETLTRVVSIFQQSYKIPCTGCNYCLPCPQNVNIPGCFAAYNVSYTSGYMAGLMQYVTGTGAANPLKQYSGRSCVQCGACEKRCPQHIGIRTALEHVTRRMEPLWFRAGLRLFEKLRK